MDAWRAGMLAHSRLNSFRRLVDRTRGEIEAALASGDYPFFVAFSGGKDSTLLLHLVRGVSGEATAYHIEDELIAPGTTEFVGLVAGWDGVSLTRLAAPNRHGPNITSWSHQPYLRPLPPDALWFDRVDDLYAWEVARRPGAFVGTRREENSRRDISYKVHGSLYDNKRRGMRVSTPLHGWRVTDVWAYLVAHDVPYHPGYDLMRAAGIAAAHQRIGPAGNERALQGMSLSWLRITWPEYFRHAANKYPWMHEYA